MQCGDGKKRLCESNAKGMAKPLLPKTLKTRRKMMRRHCCINVKRRCVILTTK